jgi:hypothetical protein
MMLSHDSLIMEPMFPERSTKRSTKNAVMFSEVLPKYQGAVNETYPVSCEM